MKQITILGSTGSIGVSALDVISRMPDCRAFALCAKNNWELVLRQAKKFKPKYVVLTDKNAAEKIKNSLPKGTKLLPPDIESVMEISAHPKADLIINGLTGACGFAPLLSAIKAGKTIALANKEPIVMAGPAIMKECQRWEAAIIPVDSEPSAIMQCLNSGRDEIKKIILTASGGPFYNKKINIDKVKPADALAHPRWKMGPKITIDSATLMNKGFELIEIMVLFGLKAEQIEIVIHPQSVIHSAVEYIDGSVIAQMSLPDMRIPIQYAISFPRRLETPAPKLNLFETTRFDFAKPNLKYFPCLALALKCAKSGGAWTAALSAADEVAVSAFLNGRISFGDIARVIGKTLDAGKFSAGEISIGAAVEIDSWAREKTQQIITGLKR